MPEYNRERVYDKVINTIANISGTDLIDLTGKTELIVDLNLDSLAIFEIVIELEEAFDLRISDEDIDRIKTIDEVVEYIANQIAADPGKKV